MPHVFILVFLARNFSDVTGILAPSKVHIAQQRVLVYLGRHGFAVEISCLWCFPTFHLWMCASLFCSPESCFKLVTLHPFQIMPSVAAVLHLQAVIFSFCSIKHNLRIKCLLIYLSSWRYRNKFREFETYLHSFILQLST